MQLCYIIYTSVVEALLSGQHYQLNIYICTCTVFLNIPQDPNIIWDANISLSVISLSLFIGTFILWDVDNLLMRLIS